MKSVLVTGATGFIGGYVVNELLNKGISVTATSSNLAKAANKDWFSKATYLPMDLKELDAEANYFEFFNSPDIIIHLAWEGLPNYKSLFHFEENLPRHYRFLKNLVVNGAKDITVIGTCFEYGMQEGELLETMPALPTNPYGLAKDTLRKQLEELNKFYPFSLKWPRLFYMYGVGQNPKSLFSQLEVAIERGDTVFNMSGGEQVRDFLPVEEIAANIVTIALQNKIEGVINCSSGIPKTVKTLVGEYLVQQKATIQLNLGFYPYPDYEPMRFWGNIEKLTKIKNNE
jgi:dTDP-6-deoxy-L-talose 4-dehydrogenase (NAD+)